MGAPPPGRARAPLWVWALSVLLLIGLIWWPFPEPTRSRDEPIPVARVVDDPERHLGVTVSGTATVNGPASTRAFWVVGRSRRLLVLLDDALPALPATLRPGAEAQLLGMIEDPRRLPQARLRRLDERSRRFARRERAVLHLHEIRILRAGP